MLEHLKKDELNRYSVIKEKNRREILLLRGRGCFWKKCTFCDYHFDFSLDEDENIALNSRELAKVTGVYRKLEIINSGSFNELPIKTQEEIAKICKEKCIDELIFESHYLQKEKTIAIREYYKQFGIKVTIKIGVESFDVNLRENILKKGIKSDNAAEIAEYFDECCLLQGISGQTKESMLLDIEIALKHFKRVCINLMQENTMPIKPDSSVLNIFMHEIYPLYKENARVDILLHNTDFGVGSKLEF